MKELFTLWLILALSFNSYSQTKSIKNGSYFLRNEMGFGRSIKIHNKKFKETSGGCTHKSYSKGSYKVIKDTAMVLYFSKHISSSINLNSYLKLLQNDTLDLKLNPNTNSLEFSEWRVKEIKNKEFRKDWRRSIIETNFGLMHIKRERKKEKKRKAKEHALPNNL